MDACTPKPPALPPSAPDAVTVRSPETAPRRPVRWRAYALAVAATGAALGLRLGLATWFGDRPVLILFIIPIIISAYVGGLGPGLVCTGLVALSTDWFLMPPTHSLAKERPEDFAQWLIMVLSGVLISLLSAELHRAQRGAQAGPADAKLSATERRVLGSFAFALACLGVIGVVSYLSVTQLRADAAQVQHTHEVITRLDLLLATANDAETGQRVYVITGDES